MRFSVLTVYLLCPSCFLYDADGPNPSVHDEEVYCEDLSACRATGGVTKEYSCPDAGPGVECWNMAQFCGADFLCATDEEACTVACGYPNCISHDTDPGIPACEEE